MIRALIVDDEPLARQGLRARLTAATDVEVVGEACDGPEAVAMILALQPDLLFLDIQMPEMNGFEVLERVAGVHLPCVIFVSAYDAFALKAFEVHALDYLLKPWSFERFEEAMRRARVELGSDAPGSRQRVAALLDSPRATDGDEPLTSFVVRDRGHFLRLSASEVDWIKAAENYVELHARDATFLARHTMKDLVEKLDRTCFARIHRSIIVRRDRVREVRVGASGDAEVILHGGQLLPMSRTYRDALRDRSV